MNGNEKEAGLIDSNTFCFPILTCNCDVCVCVFLYVLGIGRKQYHVL